MFSLHWTVPFWEMVETLKFRDTGEGRGMAMEPRSQPNTPRPTFQNKGDLCAPEGQRAGIRDRRYRTREKGTRTEERGENGQGRRVRYLSGGRCVNWETLGEDKVFN